MPMYSGKASFMGDVAAAKSVFERFYERFEPFYVAKCGEGDTFPLIAADYSSYLDARGIDARQLLRGPPSQAMSTFEGFIGDGEGCHHDSPTGQAISAAREIKAVKDPTQRTLALFRFVDAYLHKIEKLHLLAVNAVQMETAPSFMLESIHQLAVSSENLIARFWAEIKQPVSRASSPAMVADMWRALQNHFQPAGREIAYAQTAFVETIHHVLRAALLGVDPSRGLTESGLPRFLGPFLNVYRKFGNPFEWIHWSYVHNAFDNKSLIVVGPRTIPNINPVSPTEIRRVIDLIVFNASLVATRQHTVHIEFSWDHNQRLMNVTSRELAQMPAAFWRQISQLIGDWNPTIVHLDYGSAMISIPVPLKGDSITPPPGEKNGGGNGSERPPYSRDVTSGSTQEGTVTGTFSPEEVSSGHVIGRIRSRATVANRNVAGALRFAGRSRSIYRIPSRSFFDRTASAVFSLQARPLCFAN